VTDISSVSGERMGEGPGKGGGADLTKVAGNSEDIAERFATDSESGIRAGILVAVEVRAVPTGAGCGKGRRIPLDGTLGVFQLLVALQ
jgi:hypothetical protein